LGHSVYSLYSLYRIADVNDNASTTVRHTFEEYTLYTVLYSCWA